MTEASRVALVGVGTMGEALLAGSLDGGLPPDAVQVSARRRERVDELTARYAIAGTTSNAEAADGAAIVVLAVGPQAVPEVLAEIGDRLADDAVLACIADGVSLADLHAHLPGHGAVARVMPSLAAQVGGGVTLLTCSEECTDSQAGAVAAFFARSGRVLRVAEEEQAVLAPLSSGGPAYFFYVAAAMVDAGVRRGIPRDRARDLVADALAGAAGWMAAGDEEPERLTEKVCSPGGAGARRIAVLDDRRVPEAFLAALS